MELKPLRDQDRFLQAKDVSRPVASVIGTPPGIVEHNILVGHAVLDGVLAHGLGLVVAEIAIVAAHQQLLNLSRLV